MAACKYESAKPFWEGKYEEKRRGGKTNKQANKQTRGNKTTTKELPKKENMLHFVVIIFESWLAWYLIWTTMHFKTNSWKFDMRKRNMRGYTHNLTSIQGLLSAFRTFPALDLVLILQTHPWSVCAEIQELWSEWETAYLRTIPVSYTKCHFRSMLCKATCYRRWNQPSRCKFLLRSIKKKRSLMWFYGLL